MTGCNKSARPRQIALRVAGATGALRPLFVGRGRRCRRLGGGYAGPLPSGELATRWRAARDGGVGRLARGLAGDRRPGRDPRSWRARAQPSAGGPRSRWCSAPRARWIHALIIVGATGFVGGLSTSPRGSPPPRRRVRRRRVIRRSLPVAALGALGYVLPTMTNVKAETAITP